MVDFVNCQPTTLGRYEEASLVTISSVVDAVASAHTNGALPKLEVKGIAGIDQALTNLNRFLGNFNRQFKFTWAQRSCAVLLHGGHGTGKTFILDKIIDSRWGKAIRVEGDVKPATIRSIFKDAKLSQPSIIVIDELDVYVSKEDSLSQNIAKALGDELDILVRGGSSNSLPRVLVLATALDASCIPLSLKKRGRFRTDISLPIPDAVARKAILKSLEPPVHPDAKDQMLSKLGDRTHAYTAEDLVSLLDTACEIAEERTEAEAEAESFEQEYYLNQNDIEQALLLVRPTAMHDITLQPPSVKWDEIGGQENVKKALRRAVQTPLEVSPKPVCSLPHLTTPSILRE